MLQQTPAWPFTARVKLARAAKCSTPPAWLSPLLADGVLLNFDLLMMQAGRHFANSLNPAVLPGSGSNRRKAADLAWYLIAMASPSRQSVAAPKTKAKTAGKQESRLAISKPDDPDIQRLVSEILGVGFALEVLRAQRFIDARTIAKLHSRFDFSAHLLGGAGRVRIEVKGTVDGVSLGKHRTSILAKLSKSDPNYAQSIGLIANLQTVAGARKWDVEVLDPVEDSPADRDAAIRDAIRHYARVFDEDVQMGRPAEFLWDLASQQQPIESIKDLKPWLSYIPKGSSREPRFSRASLKLNISGESVQLLGGYWDSRAVAPPLSVDVTKYPLAYVGVDSRIIEFLREKKFDEFLSYRTTEGVFEFVSQDTQDVAQSADVSTAEPLSGVIVLQADGSAHAWLSRIPQGEILSTE